MESWLYYEREQDFRFFQTSGICLVCHILVVLLSLLDPSSYWPQNTDEGLRLLEVGDGDGVMDHRRTLSSLARRGTGHVEAFIFRSTRTGKWCLLHIVFFPLFDLLLFFDWWRARCSPRRTKGRRSSANWRWQCWRPTRYIGGEPSDALCRATSRRQWFLILLVPFRTLLQLGRPTGSIDWSQLLSSASFIRLKCVIVHHISS